MLTHRSFIEGDYETYIEPLIEANMKELFVKNFGGWSRKVSEKKFHLVAEELGVQLFFLDNIFIGYVGYTAERDTPDSLLLEDIHITSKEQKKGYGSQLLNYVENYAKENNCTRIKLFVFANNPSVAFYEKKGFFEHDFIQRTKTKVMVKPVKQ